MEIKEATFEECINYEFDNLMGSLQFLENSFEEGKKITSKNIGDIAQALVKLQEKFNEYARDMFLPEWEWKQIKEAGYEYCAHCGFVFEKSEAEGACPFCVLDEDLSYKEQELIVLQNRRNKLNRKISALKKQTLK